MCVAGGARADLLRQIRADVTGVPVSRPDDVETTARGAAMLAASGAGLHATAARRRPRWPARGSTGSARPRAARLYDELHGRYRALYAALRPLF